MSQKPNPFIGGGQKGKSTVKNLFEQTDNSKNLFSGPKKSGNEYLFGQMPPSTNEPKKAPQLPVGPPSPTQQKNTFTDQKEQKPPINLKNLQIKQSEMMDDDDIMNSGKQQQKKEDQPISKVEKQKNNVIVSKEQSKRSQQQKQVQSLQNAAKIQLKEDKTENKQKDIEQREIRDKIIASSGLRTIGLIQNELQQNKQIIQKQENEIKNLRREVTKKLEEKQFIHSDIKKLNNRYKYLQDNRDDEKAEKEKEQLIQKIKDLKQKIGFVEKDVEILREKISSFEQQQNKQSTKIYKLEEELKKSSVLSKMIKEVQQNKDKINQIIQSYQGKVKKFTESYKQSKKQIIQFQMASLIKLAKQGKELQKEREVLKQKVEKSGYSSLISISKDEYEYYVIFLTQPEQFYQFCEFNSNKKKQTGMISSLEQKKQFLLRTLNDQEFKKIYIDLQNSKMNKKQKEQQEVNKIQKQKQIIEQKQKIKQKIEQPSKNKNKSKHQQDMFADENQIMGFQQQKDQQIIQTSIKQEIKPSNQKLQGQRGQNNQKVQSKSIQKMENVNTQVKVIQIQKQITQKKQPPHKPSKQQDINMDDEDIFGDQPNQQPKKQNPIKQTSSNIIQSTNKSEEKEPQKKQQQTSSISKQEKPIPSKNRQSDIQIDDQEINFTQKEIKKYEQQMEKKRKEEQQQLQQFLPQPLFQRKELYQISNKISSQNTPNTLRFERILRKHLNQIRIIIALRQISEDELKAFNFDRNKYRKLVSQRVELLNSLKVQPPYSQKTLSSQLMQAKLSQLEDIQTEICPMEVSFNEEYIESLTQIPKEMIKVTKQELFEFSLEQQMKQKQKNLLQLEKEAKEMSELVAKKKEYLEKLLKQKQQVSKKQQIFLQDYNKKINKQLFPNPPEFDNLIPVGTVQHQYKVSVKNLKQLEQTFNKLKEVTQIMRVKEELDTLMRERIKEEELLAQQKLEYERYNLNLKNDLKRQVYMGNVENMKNHPTIQKLERELRNLLRQLDQIRAKKESYNVRNSAILISQIKQP